MKHLSAGRDRRLVSTSKVVDTEADVGTGGPLSLGLVEREVHESALRPADGGVASADPTVVRTVVTALVIRRVEIEAEAVSVQRRGPVEVSDLKYDGDEARSRISHVHILAAAPRPVPARVLRDCVNHRDDDKVGEAPDSKGKDGNGERA